MAERQQAGQVITFYSYKGGTGRSMALANVACLLAQGAPTGKGVLMIDWDLEAPGLHRYFHDKLCVQAEQTEEEMLETSPGLIDLFKALDTATQQSAGQREEAARELLDSLSLADFVIPTTIPALFLLKAGRFDVTYPTRVNTFQWAALYDRSPFLFRVFAEWLTTTYQYVLIDSRTGLTDISSICTVLLPEKLVVVFTPNRQSLEGLLQLVRRATDYRRQVEDLRPLLAFPLPSRIETAESQLREDWRLGNIERGITGYQPQFEALLQDIHDLPECHLDTYFDEVQIPHSSRYAYGEEIAVLVERVSDSLSLTRRYESFTERLVSGSGPWDEGKQAAHAPMSTPESVTNSLDMAFTLIPAGEFQMGARDGGVPDEEPAHTVTISQAFYLGIYAVTQGQWEAVMGDNPSHFVGDPQRPVAEVSWEDVQVFIQRLNAMKEGMRYRLPTEAEWEYAARAGTTTAYSFGNDAGLLIQYAWYNKNAKDTTHPVGQLPPNAWGLYDMHGNVWEWVQDWHRAYTADTATDPQGPTSGPNRIVRGGSWLGDAGSCRSTFRRPLFPRNRRSAVGFRLLLAREPRTLLP